MRPSRCLETEAVSIDFKGAVPCRGWRLSRSTFLLWPTSSSHRHASAESRDCTSVPGCGGMSNLDGRQSALQS